MAAVKFRRMESKFLSGMTWGPLPWVAAAAMMGVAMVAKDEEFAVMLIVQFVVFLRPSEFCNLTVGQVIRPQQGSGASSWALLLAPEEELKASKAVEFGESVLLDGHLSVALGKALTRCTAGKQDGSDTPLEPISGTVGRGCGSKRDHDSSLPGSSRRSVVRCASANSIVDGNSKTRQMAQREERQEVRKARSVARGNLEAVRRHAKGWTTGDEPHVAAAHWRCATTSARVDKTDSQSRMISETRCRAKLHGIFKHAQRQSRDGWVVLLFGRFRSAPRWPNCTSLFNRSGALE